MGLLVYVTPVIVIAMSVMAQGMETVTLVTPMELMKAFTWPTKVRVR